MLSIAGLTLGLFGAALCLMQARDIWPFRALATVLLASTAMELASVPWPFSDALTAARYEAASAILWLLGLTSIAPLFWHYVCVLTAVTPSLPRPLWVHCVLPGMAAMLACLVIIMPQDARLGLFTDLRPLPDGWPFWVGAAGEALVLAALVQWGLYVAAIVRALLRYRKRLGSYVANTARKELRWIWVIIFAFSGYWLISAVDAMVELSSDGSVVSDLTDSVASFVLLVIILLWGLRQRPALAPDTALPDAPAEKYERSALTPEMAGRIERKLRHAMTADRLHHDANLSLWALARHIGASPNYISQTLNDRIGESFFDFVNGHRIADAQTLLRETDKTVLEIAYDVGFNSRSSFYTAFGKVTGQTPTAYRKAMSERV